VLVGVYRVVALEDVLAEVGLHSIASVIADIALS
jgi:hypothetical protein